MMLLQHQAQAYTTSLAVIAETVMTAAAMVEIVCANEFIQNMVPDLLTTQR